jgi:plasmid maintenance system killer protein
VPPGNRLEALKGTRAGQYSIRINDQFRLCFRWSAHDAEVAARKLRTELAAIRPSAA